MKKINKFVKIDLGGFCGIIYWGCMIYNDNVFEC